MKRNTAELEGALLDAAVAKAEGLPVHPGRGRYMVAAPIDQRWAHEFAFSTLWRDGGPIIERERIATVSTQGEWMAWHASFIEVGGSVESEGNVTAFGPTPLIAAMRAYVASKFGEEVELP